MSISSHRNYVSSTAEDLERAAGLMKIKASQEVDVRTKNRLIGASKALYLLASFDINHPDDFWTLFKAYGFEEESTDGTEIPTA